MILLFLLLLLTFAPLVGCISLPIIRLDCLEALFAILFRLPDFLTDLIPGHLPVFSFHMYQLLILFLCPSVFVFVFLVSLAALSGIVARFRTGWSIGRSVPSWCSLILLLACLVIATRSISDVSPSIRERIIATVACVIQESFISFL